MADISSGALTEVQVLVGTPLTGDPDRVEYNDVRFFAEAIRWPATPNPLYHDEAYARQGRFGGLIAPPSYLTRLARRGGYPWPMPQPQWLQDRPAIGAGVEIERVAPIRVGDTIFTKAIVAEIREAVVRDSRLLFMIRDYEFTNQLGQYVGKTRRNTVKFLDSLIFDPGEDLAGDDDVAGEAVPGFSRQVTLMELNQFAGANREWGRYHMDRDFAQTLGLRDVLVIENLQSAYIANMLEDWLPADGWIHKIAVQYQAILYVGDTLVTHARVRSKSARDGQIQAECAVWIENQDGQRCTSGTATVSFPAGSA